MVGGIDGLTSFTRRVCFPGSAIYDSFYHHLESTLFEFWFMNRSGTGAGLGTETAWYREELLIINILYGELVFILACCFRKQHSQDTELRACNFWCKTGLEEWEKPGNQNRSGEACYCPDPTRQALASRRLQARAPHASLMSSLCLFYLSALTFKFSGCLYRTFPSPVTPVPVRLALLCFQPSPYCRMWARRGSSL